MKKVYIAHPLRGAEREKNVAEVTKICRKITELFPDVLPVSPIHAFSFLDNCGEEGEKKALELCLDLLKSCDEVWFFGDWRKSEGCRFEYRESNIMRLFGPEESVNVLSMPKRTEQERALARWLLSEVYEPPLAPCPFCGGVAKVTAYGNEGTFSEGSVDCQNRLCPAYVRVCWGKHDVCKTKTEAIAAWNRRAE